MTQFNAPTYDVQRPSGQCAFTGRSLTPGEKYISTLVEYEAVDEHGKPVPGPGFKRVDVSLEAWGDGRRPERMFSHWRTTVPQPHQKKKLFVDDEVLLSLFERLADSSEPDRQAFRFVLGLILMRKKVLRYEGMKSKPGSDASGGAAGGQEIWLMTPRGREDAVELVNPEMDEQKIQQVTSQLSEILQAEL